MSIAVWKPTQQDITDAIEIVAIACAEGFSNEDRDHKPCRWGSTSSYRLWKDAQYDNPSKYYSVHSGATRVVIVPRDQTTFVIKCDILQDDCDAEHHGCAREVTAFEDALREGLGDYLAAEYFLINYDGIDFYIQEYMKCGHDEVYCHIAETYRGSDIYNDFLDQRTNTIQQYDNLKGGYVDIPVGNDPATLEYQYHDYIYNLCENDWSNLLDTITEGESTWLEDNGLHDLHQDNVGISKEGLIKIVDYAGYGYEGSNYDDEEEDESDDEN